MNPYRMPRNQVHMHKQKSKLRVGDTVIVMSGNHKGETGKVQTINLVSQQVTVSNVNIRKKHKKPSTKDPAGGIISFPAPLALSSVAYYDDATSSATRIGYRIEDGKKIRFSKKTKKTIPIPEPVRKNNSQ